MYWVCVPMTAIFTWSHGISFNKNSQRNSAPDIIPFRFNRLQVTAMKTCSSMCIYSTPETYPAWKWKCEHIKLCVHIANMDGGSIEMGVQKTRLWKLSGQQKMSQSIALHAKSERYNKSNEKVNTTDAHTLKTHSQCMRYKAGEISNNVNKIWRHRKWRYRKKKESSEFCCHFLLWFSYMCHR